MDYALQHIGAWLVEHQQPKYRMKQISDAWYTGTSWDAVTTLPKDVRAELSEQFPWFSFEKVKVFTSPKDGTQKAIITLKDGQKIESVLMPNARDTKTVCISSQVGCGMGCTFCATGTMGLKRNLTVDEMVDQVRWWRSQVAAEGETAVPITNIVLMGMGEPLANYDVVKQAVHMFINDMAIGKTRIVLSTVAFPVGLKRLMADATFPDVRIAISLHAGTDATRAKIVPSHKHNSIKQIVEAVEEYLETRSNRRHHLTFEYVMLLNVNDMSSEAEALVKTFSHLKDQIKFNLIPWNQTTAQLQRSSDKHMRTFQYILTKAGLTSTIRYSKGLDITAACGQLVVNADKKL